MFLLLRVSLFVLPFFAITALAGDSSYLRHGQNLYRRASNATFTLKDLYQGEAFLEEWDFFNEKDPTNGLVNYQSKKNATSKKLAKIEHDGSFTLAVDDFNNLPPKAYRDSVRISTKKTYSHGLFIADFIAIPYGCSLWPAYWSVGPDWPSAGEMDIVEGVHNVSTNLYVLHSSPDCQIKAGFGRNEVTSNQLYNICTSSQKDNRGCGFSDPDERSYGLKFKSSGGGVFAHLWDSSGVTIWRFTRENIPSDIKLKRPKPATWGTPAALFPSSESCDFPAHFFNHTLVLDITICGDYGNGTYKEYCPGKCEDAVQNKENYKNAKWKIKYIAVYDS